MFTLYICLNFSRLNINKPNDFGGAFMYIQLFQIEIEPANASKNKEKIRYLFEQYVDDSIDLVVLPEMWNNGYALDRLYQLADVNLKDSYPFIKNLAKTYDVDIIAGSVSNQKKTGLYNTAFAVNRQGYKIYEYDKIHLVPMLDEPRYLDAGQKVPYTFTLSDGIQGTQIICYDLRFPELSRYPSATGAEILFYVAQWPITRLSHWRSLLQARAIENDAYVVATNSCGHDGKTEYAGHSMIISPNGDVIDEANEHETVITAKIDISKVAEQRQKIPVFENMRPNIYRYFNHKNL